MDDAHSLMQDEWQRALAKDQAKATELFGHSEEEQRRLGYFHTIREICQQPWTWLRTCDRMLDSRDGLNEDLKGIHSLALTGSGSSEYAGECVRFPLQNALGIPTESISGGALLMYGGKALSPGRAGVVVFVARAGGRPESSGARELRSEEGRVGEEGRSRWWAGPLKKKKQLAGLLRSVYIKEGGRGGRGVL